MRAKIHRILRFIDHILSPPANYVNLTYVDRFRRQLVDLKAGRNRLANLIHVIRFGFMLGLSHLLTPAAWLLKKSGYRFVDIDLRQIGSALYLDLLIRRDRLERQTPRRKLLVLSSRYTDGNFYLFDLYRDHVTFIRNPFLKSALSPFFVSPLFKDDSSFPYDTVLFSTAICHDIWNDYDAKFGRPLVSFPERDLAKARELLARYIPSGTKFVTLHVRDSGFYGDTARTTRNSDINTYQKAVEYLIERDYAVVRLGDRSAVSIERMVAECGPMLFDYAHSDIRSEMMDTYLLSSCDFFIGGPSGPSSVPMIFGIGSCNVNWNNIINAPNFLAGDITAFKKPRDRKTGALIPLERMFEPPYSHSLTNTALEKYDLTLEDNTPEEILATLVEFVEERDRPRNALQERAQSFFTERHYAFHAKGKISTALLRQYFS